jgi:hypothetical protein
MWKTEAELSPPVPRKNLGTEAFFFAIARNITSCTFIARSIAALGSASMLRMVSHPHRPQSGHFMCYLNRTYHVLPTLVLVSR